MKYKLIGIDLDGTLLTPGGEISETNREAMAAAAEAGAMLLPCTGRSWREAMLSIDDVDQFELGVFVTGAAVCEVPTGSSVDLADIEPHLAKELVDALKDEPEAVLVYRDPQLAGHDYLITGNGRLTDNTDWWFTITGSTTYEQRNVAADDLHHALRVGIVARASRVVPMQQRIGEQFTDRVLVHHFAALTQPDEEPIHVLEIFAAGVNKWRGLRWIAEQRGIDTSQIAAIGDEINDVSMLRNAACGVVVSNGTDDAKAAADHECPANVEDGVAVAIEKMLSGKW